MAPPAASCQPRMPTFLLQVCYFLYFSRLFFSKNKIQKVSVDVDLDIDLPAQNSGWSVEDRSKADVDSELEGKVAGGSSARRL